MSLALALPLIGKVIDKLFPDPAQRDEAKLKLLELEQQGSLAELQADLQLALGQIETNKEEAKSGSMFVAGARPAIMWICGAALAWTYVCSPMVAWIGFLAGYDVSQAPQIETGELMPLLTGLLGLAGLRTYEKRTGSATMGIG